MHRARHGAPAAAGLFKPSSKEPIMFPSFNHRPALRRALLASVVVLALAGCSSMSGMMPSMSKDTVALGATLSGTAEVPPNASNGSGTVEASLNKSTHLLRWKVSYAGLSGPVSAGHFHGPAMAGQNAGVVLPFKGSMASPIEGEATLTPEQEADLMAGKWYANLHTAAHPGGEVRGQVTPRP
jgi:hypothetical protein